jgi:hypothetical protein
LCLFFTLAAKGQADSTLTPDTARPIVKRPSIVRHIKKPDSAFINRPDSLNRADTFKIQPMVITPKNFDSLVLQNHPFYRFTEPIRTRESVRIPPMGKEDLFYSVIGLLLFYALIRNSFHRYMQDLFRLLFRTKLQQRQAREQLMQTPFASLLLNILFVLSTSLFINLVLRHYHLGLNYPFWVLFFYCSVGLTVMYLIKYFTLKIFGWIFRVTDATDVYTMIVFTVNKVVGIFLLPFIIFMAFTSGTISQFMFTLSLLMVAGLFVYRYYISYSAVHRQVRINFFHFLLYLFAFEIIPLLLINKLLFGFLS